MNKTLFIIADYLKGKPIYSPIRRILNFLFIIGIVSFIYEKIYGKYTWIDYNDYKGILDFFVKGEFFIPLSIFIIVLGFTQTLSIIVFNGINHLKEIKWTRDIINYEVKNELIEQRLNQINEASKRVSPVDVTTPLLIELYKSIKENFKPELYDKIEIELQEPKKNLEATFHLLFRGLIAIVLYFISLPKFGWVLFIFILITLYLSLYVTMIAHRFLDTLPTLVRKFHIEAEKYILNYFRSSSELDQ